jgi:methionyl-tRNA formyltransferase
VLNRLIVAYIYSMDLYLCGTKGLAALEAALKYPHVITSVKILPDAGVLNDPYELMLQLVKKHELRLVPKDYPIFDSEALAVGWKFLIQAPHQRLFVIHDSLLPKYRGWNPLVTALQNREPEIGVTLLLADEKIDHGPIVDQRIISVTYPQKIAEAMHAIEEKIGDIVTVLLEQSDRTNLQTHKQVEDSATYSIWRDEEDYRIDWTKSADDILAFIDSVSFPYKGATTSLNGETLRVFSARVVSDLLIVNRTPGKIWKIENGNPTILCGSGLLELQEYLFEDQTRDSSQLKRLKSRFI